MTEASQQVGAMLAGMRRAEGLTQRELAERLGCHQSAVARWEQGRHNLTHVRVGWIAAELGYEVEYDLRVRSLRGGPWLTIRALWVGGPDSGG